MTDSKSGWIQNLFKKDQVPKPEPIPADQQETNQPASNQVKSETNLAVKPYDDCYNMQNENRGVALIFNHKHFEVGYCSERYGTEKDRDSLGAMLTKLKFNVIIHNDLSMFEIMLELKRVGQKMDHTSSDCLVVAVMSHGSNDKLYAKDRSYPTRILWDFFSADKCPSLAGKPKLFFIQACRGRMTDPGVQIKYKDETDSRSSDRLYSIPIMADILIMYSTVEGYYAWRDPVAGSCFIQALVKQLEENHDKRDLLTILTFVNRQVAIEFTSIEPNHPEFNGKKEMCSIVSMLTRLLYFK